jgi:RNA polymerase primary sigma factor
MGTRIAKLGRARSDLIQTLGREPTEQELAAHVALPLARVQEALEAERRASTASLNEPIEGGKPGTELGDFIADTSQIEPEVGADRAALRLLLHGALETLTPQEQRILVLRYGLRDGREHTLGELGHKFGLTRERIRQIEVKALEKLRHPSKSRGLKPYY